MPIVEITLIEGRDTEGKADLMAAVTRAVSDSLAVPAESVRVILREIPVENYASGGIQRPRRYREES